MADNLTDMMQRERNMMNNDGTNVNNARLLHPSLLSRKISDHNNMNNSNDNQRQFIHQELVQSPPMITTTDYSDASSLRFMSVSKNLFNHQNLNSGYDTDGAIGTSRLMSKHHPKINSGYEYLVSPRLTSKRSTAKTSQRLPAVSSQSILSKQNYLAVNPSVAMAQSQDDRDEESSNEIDATRRHIRLSRRIHQTTSLTQSHGAQNTTSSTISHRDTVLAATSSWRPLRLIFIRHGERANQALGSDWFSKAFRTGIYRAYDQNLPVILPKRRFDQAYEFDPPLTVRGLKTARHMGRVMLNANIIADVCISSTALRCVQTCERILSGMDRRDNVPLRVEPGLFECPHLNPRIVESFMSKKELVENGYNIKVEYKPLIQSIIVPESLDEYFQRCTTVMRGIIDRYGHHGGNVLIVTHAPGLLALTDAIKGLRPNHETFYRTVASYPPLAAYIADYDGKQWKFSEQPFSVSSFRQ